MDDQLEVTKNSLDYAWVHLCKVACIPKELPIEVNYGNIKIGFAGGLSIKIMPYNRTVWEKIENNVKEIPVVDLAQMLPPGSGIELSRKIPVLFPSIKAELSTTAYIENPTEKSLVLNFDIIAATLFMLCRYEEFNNQQLDEHGRFPGVNSFAYKAGLLDRPIIDEYAILIREWIKWLVPRWKPEKPGFLVEISHDIDHLEKKMTWKKNLAVLFQDIFHAYDPGLFLRDFNNLINGSGIYPYLPAAIHLIDSAETNNIKPVFYLMAAPKNQFNEGYDLRNRKFDSFIDNLNSHDFQVGLHAGYESYLNSERLKQEKGQFELAIGKPVTHIRHHYLQIKCPDTWRLWEQAGFLHDSSMGYHDVEGFRCGTCHPFPLFDMVNDRCLNVMEHPLIVMDGTLFARRNYSMKEARDRIFYLSYQCKKVGGVFSILWHNTSIIRDLYDWGKMYFELLPDLLNMQVD